MFVKSLLLAAVLTISVGSISPVWAQNSNAVNSAKIEVLERQVTMLRTRLGMNPAAPEARVRVDAPDANPALLADLSAKVGSLESQIRRLNGRLEELEYGQRQMQEGMASLRAEVALQRREGARGAGGLTSTGLGAEASSSVLPAGSVASDGGQPLSAVDEAPAATISVTLPEGDAALQYDYAFSFVQKNDLVRAKLALEKFIAANAGDTRVGNAKYWIGRIHMLEGRNAAAAQQLLALIEEHPNHKKRTDALVDLAEVLLKLESAGDACDALAEFSRVEDKASARLKARAALVKKNARCEL